MYLVDTNVFLEIFLRREHSPEAKKFLRQTPFSDIYVSDHSLDTLGIILFKHNMFNAYVHFIKDLFLDGGVWRIQLALENIQKVGDAAKKYNLNYHDAYQYVTAELYDLTLVSLNDAFDQTERGRKPPAALVKNDG